MKAKSLLVTIGLVVLSGIVAIQGGLFQSQPQQPDTLSLVADEAEHEAELEDPRRRSDLELPGSDMPSVAGAESEESGVRSAVPVAMASIRCRLTCEGRDGVWFAPAVARVVFRIGTEETSRDFHGGLFEGDFEGVSFGATAEVVAVEVEGLPMALRPSSQTVRMGAKELQEITARQLPPPITLHVIDAATGVDLQDVKIAEDSYMWVDDLAAPGVEINHRIWSGGSPVEVQPLEHMFGLARGRLRVGADGYAWQRISFDLEKAAEYTVALEPGGVVEVVVTLPGERAFSEEAWEALSALGYGGPISAYHMRLERTVAPDVGLAAIRRHMPPATSHSLFTGLLPGSYLVEQLYQPTGELPQVIGTAEVQVKSGQHVSIVLEVHPVQPQATAPVQVTLVAPGAWSLPSPLRLGLRASTDSGVDVHIPLQGEQLGSGQWIFDAEAVPVGSYLLELESPHFSRQVEVTLDGLYERMDLPSALEITVRVVEGESNALADIDTLTWTHLGGDYTNGPPSDWVHTKTPGEFHFAAPAGPLFLMPSGMDEAFRKSRVELTANGQSFELELLRLSQFKITIELDGKPLDGPALEVITHQLVIEGPGRLHSISLLGSILSAHVTEPGHYRVGLSASSRFELDDMLEIEVKPSGGQELTMPIKLAKD